MLRKIANMCYNVDMKKIFTLSNLFLVASFVASLVIAIMFSSTTTWFIAISAFSGILFSKAATEGKWYAFLFDIVSYIFYLYVLCVVLLNMY